MPAPSSLRARLDRLGVRGQQQAAVAFTSNHFDAWPPPSTEPRSRMVVLEVRLHFVARGEGARGKGIAR